MNSQMYKYMFSLFSLMLIPGLGLFSVCDDAQSYVFFLAAPSFISISHIDVGKRYRNEKIWVSSSNTNNIFIQVKSRIYIMSTRFSFIKVVSYLKF